jgi:hypothetical protein
MKNRAILIMLVVIMLAGKSAWLYAVQLTDVERNLVFACEQVVKHYAYYRDRLDYEGYGKLFTTDAVLLFPGGMRYQGRDAIVEALRERGPQTVTRHLVTAVKIIPNDNTTATGTSYVLVYGYPAGPEITEPVTVKGYSLVGEYRDAFRMVDGECLIQQRELIINMTGPGQN